MLDIFDTCFCVGVVLTLFILPRWLGGTFEAKRRPGPPGLPFVGNILDVLGSEDLWEKARKWGREYGEFS